MSAHRNFRTWMDAFGLAYFAILGAIAVASLVLDIHYWGISGIFLGRLFNRNDGGGVHTLATLGVLIPTFMWGRKLGMNNMIVAVSAQLTDYYHEGIWNIPYYLYYHKDVASQVPYYGGMALVCMVWFGTIIYSKKQHKFSHALYLTPWLVMITLYLVGVHAYSEDLFGPQAYYSNVLVNAYEILEVNIFAWSLYFALTRGKRMVPVLATVFTTRAQIESPITVATPRPGVGQFLNYALGFPIFWVIIIDVGLAWSLGLSR